MATGESSRRTWISSRELQRLSSNAQSPASPDRAALTLSLEPASALTKDVSWFKKVPCCHLKCSEGGGTGQGIIVCLGLDGDRQNLSDVLGVSTYPALALLTNHHIITSKAHAKKWKLSISGQEMRKLTVTLDEKRIDICKSCCGRDGVLGHSDHPGACCPFRADFTVLVLSKDFAKMLLDNRDLKFPILMPLGVESLKEALRSERFYIFKRDEDLGIVRDIELTLRKVQVPTSDDQVSIYGQITAYKQMCLLSYETNDGVGPGDSGAGIFFKKGSERLLLGLHKSTAVEDSPEGGHHSGIAVHAIFHAITGSEVSRLIPSLSLLKDSKMYGQQKIEFYENVRACFEPKEGGSVQVSEEGDRRREITLETVVRVLEYLLKENLLVLQSKDVLTVPSVDLLATLFGYFGKNQHFHDTIKIRVREVYPDEGNRENFYKLVCDAGDKISRLCEPTQEEKIVESCFICWQNLSYFPLPRPVFSDATKVAKLIGVRNSEQFKNNLTVQRAFGDICLAYQRHIRCELQNEKDQIYTENQQQRENLLGEKERGEERMREALRAKDQREAELIGEKNVEIDALKANFQEERDDLQERHGKLEEEHGKLEEEHGKLQEQLRETEQLLVERELAIEQMRGEISKHLETIKQLEGQKRELNIENERMSRDLVQRPPGRHYSEPIATRIVRTTSNLYPTRVTVPENATPESFWSMDIGVVLNKNLDLRNELAKYFAKNTGGGGTKSWEHLIAHLQQTRSNFSMNAQELDGHPVSDILLNIVLEWGKVGPKVTVGEFCEVSQELGIGRVEHILSEVAAKASIYGSDYEQQMSSRNSGVFFESSNHDSYPACV